MAKQTILKVVGREILDSRGTPTVEAEVWLGGGVVGCGKAPSGASTGEFEAVELRDGDETRYFGKGTLKAVHHIGGEICSMLKGRSVEDQEGIDQSLIELDGTENKSRLGANATLAVSMAVADARAKWLGTSLYASFRAADEYVLPVPMMNILNGGVHAGNTVDTQEFMIMPVGAGSFREGLRWCCEVYHSLKGILKKHGLSTAVGDEGGFAPDLASDEETIELILQAIDRAGYRTYDDFVLALDAASSEWKSEKGTGYYKLPKSGKVFTSEGLIAHWEELARKYPVASIEDGLDEEDWEGWKRMTERLGGKVQLVGDDLFVTNARRLKKGVEMGAGNSLLVKPNQIGTVSETIRAVELAHTSGYTAVASHRSGETEDTFIADLSVGLKTGQIKTGAPCRSERIAKYNRLLRIEDELGASAVYAGRNAFKK